MYKKISVVLFACMLCIFGISKTTFATEKKYPVPNDGNSYYLSYDSTKSDTHIIYTFNTFSTTTNSLQGNVKEYNNGVFVKNRNGGVTFVSKLKNVKTNNNNLLKYLKDNDLIIGSSETVPPHQIPQVEKGEEMKALSQTFLQNLKTLLPVCLMVLSLCLVPSLIKRVISLLM